MDNDDINTYLNAMTKPQQLVFRHWAINVAQKRIDRWLKIQIASMPEPHPPEWDQFLAEQGAAIEAVRRWLETPNQETQALVSQLAESVESNQALRGIMPAIGNDDIQQFPGYLTRAFGWTTKAHEDAAHAGALMYRAMLRAAKIIVSDKTEG